MATSASQRSVKLLHLLRLLQLTPGTVSQPLLWSLSRLSWARGTAPHLDPITESNWNRFTVFPKVTGTVLRRSGGDSRHVAETQWRSIQLPVMPLRVCIDRQVSGRALRTTADYCGPEATVGIPSQTGHWYGLLGWPMDGQLTVLHANRVWSDAIFASGHPC